MVCKREHPLHSISPSQFSPGVRVSPCEAVPHRYATLQHSTYYSDGPCCPLAAELANFRIPSCLTQGSRTSHVLRNSPLEKLVGELWE